MNWNWASWIVVIGLIVGVGVLAYTTVGRTTERVVLPEPRTPVTPDPPPVTPDPPPPPTAPIDAGVRPVELAAECKEKEFSEPAFLATKLNFPASLEEQRRFCHTWLELMRRRTQCGNATVATALRQLDTCGKLNDMCLIGKLPTMVDVDLRDILAAAESFPLAAVYFDKESARIDPEQLRALQTFVARQISGDAARILMVFGSASPTARDEDIDLNWARKRTDAAELAVRGVLETSRMLMVQVRKASVGRGLVANICDSLRDEGLRAQCQQHDDNARRQSAFVLSYPRSCFDETPAPRTGG